VAHRTLYSTCPVCHWTSRRAQQSELQRSEPNGLVTWLLTGLSGAPCDSSLHQTASLVVGVINTPNHLTFKSSKSSNLQPLTRARHSIQDTPKVIKSSPNSTKALVTSESDLLCSFELLRLDCFLLSHSLLRSILTCNQGKRHQLCGGPCGKVLFPVDLRRESSLGPRDRLRERRG
jgi:hypothetical protein